MPFRCRDAHLIAGHYYVWPNTTAELKIIESPFDWCNAK